MTACDNNLVACRGSQALEAPGMMAASAQPTQLDVQSAGPEPGAGPVRCRTLPPGKFPDEATSALHRFTIHGTGSDVPEGKMTSEAHSDFSTSVIGAPRAGTPSACPGLATSSSRKRYSLRKHSLRDSSHPIRMRASLKYGGPTRHSHVTEYASRTGHRILRLVQSCNQSLGLRVMRIKSQRASN